MCSRSLSLMVVQAVHREEMSGRCSSPPSWYYLQMPVRCLCSPLDRGQPPPQPGSLLFLVWAPGHSQMGTLNRERSLWTYPAQDFGSFMLMATASGGCFCLRPPVIGRPLKVPTSWWDEYSQDGAWVVRRNSSRFHLWCGTGRVPTGLAPLV